MAHRSRVFARTRVTTVDLDGIEDQSPRSTGPKIPSRPDGTVLGVATLDGWPRLPRPGIAVATYQVLRSSAQDHMMTRPGTPRAAVVGAARHRGCDRL